MTDIIEFAMETLPSVLGLILILYALLQINMEKMYFFEAARSWIMVGFMASLMSVAINPGAITFAVMPRLASSRAVAFVNPMTPAFAAAYAA